MIVLNIVEIRKIYLIPSGICLRSMQKLNISDKSEQPCLIPVLISKKKIKSFDLAFEVFNFRHALQIFFF